ncbi:MAG: MOSC domain-containing protein [Oscillospiraceae bacterium]|jgi:MOSC domain-containing protein YiiM|nr:MOSC domain-containing protein [Oscillospiraceae bacterium]
MAEIVAVCTSEKKGTVKRPQPAITLQADFGIIGDAHAGEWHRQVSLLAEESTLPLKAQFSHIAPGAFAENILTKGMTLHTLPIGTRLVIEDVLLEITQIGKECHTACEIRRLTGDCVMPREGVFARVLRGGVLRPGSPITIQEVDCV